ncbi:hypothetical protein B0O99DRAFT_664867 [Bisporella sp. PMI_857]|nr:hypothetical protein B0O99DRAFT_664867 [Bisporella sp. PMI_857]
MAVLSLFLFAIAVLSRPGFALETRNCKYVPADSLWPSPLAWDTLNTTISGQLIAVEPVAISCYPGPLFDNKTCAEVNSQWIKCAWQADHPAGMCVNTGNLACPPVLPPAATGAICTIGNQARYAVNATSPEHVAAGIKFASENNIRLVVKTTGHDFLRRSEGFGSLEVWMRYYRTGINFQDTFESISGCMGADWTGSALKIGKQCHRGGGGAASIGAIGGWLQGGGYGPASHQYGIGADQLLEAEVVLADGSIAIANACQNTDVYTGIRGGGPSTYGVVLSATFKTYPMVGAVAHKLSLAYSQSNRSTFLDAITTLYSSYPDLIDAGYALGGFWGQSNRSLVGPAAPGYFHTAYMINRTVSEAQAVFYPVQQKLATLGLSVSVTWSSYDDYWSFFEATSGGDDPGFPLGVVYSRFLDRKSLKDNTTGLRQMIEVVAGAPDDGAIHNSACMSGGKVWENANEPHIGAHPAWRTSYCMHIAQRIWTEDADDALISSIKHDVTYIKGGALTALAPDTGTYMNEGGREDPDWKANFYGSNYNRLLDIKKQRDPNSVFYCPTCVGSDEWAEDGSGRLCQVL